MTEYFEKICKTCGRNFLCDNNCTCGENKKPKDSCNCALCHTKAVKEKGYSCEEIIKEKIKKERVKVLFT